MPGVLVSFAELLRRLDALRPGALAGCWRVEPGVRGYGEHVGALDEAVAAGPQEIEGRQVFAVLLGDREYLEHGELTKLEGEPWRLGVFDSGYLYFRGPRVLGEEVAAGFEQASVTPVWREDPKAPQ